MKGGTRRILVDGERKGLSAAWHTQITFSAGEEKGDEGMDRQRTGVRCKRQILKTSKTDSLSPRAVVPTPGIKIDVEIP